jgi:hypothetical protein
MALMAVTAATLLHLRTLQVVMHLPPPSAAACSRVTYRGLSLPSRCVHCVRVVLHMICGMISRLNDACAGRPELEV